MVHGIAVRNPGAGDWTSGAEALAIGRFTVQRFRRCAVQRFRSTPKLLNGRNPIGRRKRLLVMRQWADKEYRHAFGVPVLYRIVGLQI